MNETALDKVIQVSIQRVTPLTPYQFADLCAEAFREVCSSFTSTDERKLVQLIVTIVELGDAYILLVADAYRAKYQRELWHDLQTELPAFTQRMGLEQMLKRKGAAS